MNIVPNCLVVDVKWDTDVDNCFSMLPVRVAIAISDIPQDVFGLENGEVNEATSEWIIEHLIDSYGYSVNSAVIYTPSFLIP